MEAQDGLFEEMHLQGDLKSMLSLPCFLIITKQTDTLLLVIMIMMMIIILYPSPAINTDSSIGWHVWILALPQYQPKLLLNL